MAVPKRPIDPRWVQQELMPYLRCAFSHKLAYDADISCEVFQAIERVLKKADYYSDGDDLVFERICQAIQFRYMDLAPDLSLATENLGTLAAYMLRRAQLKGPFELLGRMNVASGAWRENEKVRLETLRLAAEQEEKDNLTLFLDPPPKAAPTEREMDPRLMNALPGHYVAPSLRGTLTVVEDQYHREANANLLKYRQQQQQAQQAAANNPPRSRTYPVPGTENWQQRPQNALPLKTLPPAYVQGTGQQFTYTGAPLRTLAPLHMPGSGQQQHAQPMQGQHGYNNLHAYQSPPPPVQQQQQMHHSPAQPTAMQAPWLDFGTDALSYAPMRPPANALCVMTPPPNVVYSLPVMSPPPNTVYDISMMSPPSPALYDAVPMMSPPSSAVYQPHPTTTSIPTADIAHLRGRQWTEAIEQRAQDFNNQPHQHPVQPSSYQQSTMSGPWCLDTSEYGGMFGQDSMYQSAPAQPQQAYQQQPPTPQAQSPMHHPSFSNVTVDFPDVNSIYWSMQNSRGQQE